MKHKSYFTTSFYMKISLLIVTVLFYNTMFAKGNISNTLPAADKGIINLQNIDFANETISLKGEWEFYWQQLLSPQDFTSDREGLLSPPLQQNRNLYTVPANWNNLKIAGKKINGHGYLTLRLLVKVKDDDKQQFMLHIPEMFSAYKLWVNDKLTAQNGVVAASEAEMQAEWRPQSVPIEPAEGDFYLTLQISNFVYKWGGIWDGIKLGTRLNIEKENRKSLAVDLIIFGSLLIMGFYHLGLFFLRKSDRSTLYFAVACLILSSRSLVTGQMFFLTLFPAVDWEVYLKLNFIGIALVAPQVMKYFSSLFPDEFSEKAVKISQIAAAAFTISIILFPASIHSHLLSPPYHIILLVTIIYLSYIQIRAVKNKREGARIALFASLFMFLTAINDILFINSIINSVQLTPLGMFVFIFAQSFMLSMKFSKSFHKVEDLSLRLKNLNDELEERVELRTLELTVANKELQQSIEKVKVLSGLIPICSSCKKIRDDGGFWNHLEEYISKHSEVSFSHGICPDCVKKLYPDFDIDSMTSD